MPLAVTALLPNLRLPRYLAAMLLVVAGVAAGLTYERFTSDPHSATAEPLTGTVTWSNSTTRLIAFETDGERRAPLLGDTIYQVTGSWVDTAGTIHGEGFPDCLAGPPGEPVSTEKRRIEIEVVRQDHGGPQKTNIAVFVRCIDKG